MPAGSTRFRENIRERIGQGYRIRGFLLAAALSVATVSAEAKDAPGLKETGSWLVKNLLDLGKRIEMAPGFYGEVTAASWTECNLIITTSIEVTALDSITVTRNDIPMRYFQEIKINKFGRDSVESTMFLHTKNNSIRWLQSDENSSGQRQNSDYTIIPVRHSGRGIKKRLEAGLHRFAKLAGENEKCKNAEPF